MTATIILAKIFGFYFIATGVALLFNPKRFSVIYQEMARNESFLLLSGVMALFLGASVISVHNIWTVSWPVLITLIGWISLAKGLGLLLYPGFVRKFSFFFDKASIFYRSMSLILIIFGLFFICKAWL